MQQQGQMMQSVIMIVVMIAIFYFLLIRPQKKRQKKHDEMLQSIKRGDVVITAGGFWGTVRDFKDDSLIIEIASGVKAKVMKSSISARVNEVSSSAEEKPAEQKPAEEPKAAEETAEEKKTD